MKKILVLQFLILSFLTSYSQGSGCPNIDVDVVGPSQTLPCNQTCTDIEAEVFEVGETDSYVVSSIAHAPPLPYNAGGGNPVSVNTDDVWSNDIPLPFPFCFFGQTYNSCIIGSNGTINFNTANAGGYSPWPFSATVPSAALTDAGNIFGPYHDIDPSESGSVRWYLTGTAPCRTFIVIYENLGYYDCTGGSFRTNHMMVLYETTNIIEVYVQNKPTCSGWNSGNSVIGIQNAAGTQGYTPPGRNTGSWTINTPEAWQFTPDGAPIYSTVEWFDGTTLVGTGPTINVCPPSEGTTYTARTTYTRCDGLDIQVEDDIAIDYETVEVDVAPRNIFTCAGSTVTLNALSSTANSFTWSPGGLTGQTVDVTPGAPTTYTVTGTNTANGCSDTATATITFAQPVSSGCNVLYVTPTGLPSNDGTKASPLDLETALELGACNGTVVKMAVGDYITDTVINKVTSFITLEGGFDPSINWDKISTAGATRILRTAVQSYSTASTSIIVGSGIANETGANPEVVAIQVNNQSGFRFQDITIENELSNPGTQYAGYEGVDMVGVRLNSCSDYNIIRTQVISDDASPGADQIFTIPATNGGNSRGIELNTNGANGIIDQSNVVAGSGGTGGAGTPAGTNGTSNAIAITGSALATNNSAFNLGGQPTIQMDDIACTATNMDYNSAASNSWNFGVGSTPNTGTGTTITTQYSSTGRKTIGYGANNYLGFANIILDDQILPAFDINVPIVQGEHRICVGENVSATATNGGVGYIYNWTITNNNTGFSATFTTPDENTGLVPMDTAGYYTVELRYETSCCGLSAPVTKDYYVEEVPEPVMPLDESFCLGVPGGVSLTVGGLTPNGTIEWQPTTGLNVSDSTTVVALPSTTTTYTTTLTDSTGLCSAIDSVQVTVTDLELTPSSTTASCSTLGTASVSVLNGSGDYDYSWSTGDNTQNISGLQPGTYSVVVTDNILGCADSTTVSVLPQAGTLVASSTSSDITCSGANNGEIVVSLEGGTAPFTYDWSHIGAPITTSDTFNVQSNLPQGVYDLEITDDGGCTFTLSDTIGEPPLIVFSIDSTRDPLCFGVDDGFIGIVPDGGVRPYSFTWSNGMPVNFVNDEVIETNLSSGTYTLTLTDDVGCVDSVSVTLNTVLITDTLRDTICSGETYTLAGGGSTILTADTLIVDSLTSPVGCDSVLYSFVTVNALPSIIASAVPNDTLCEGEQVTLTATGISSVSWNNGVTDGVPFTPSIGTTDYVVTGNTTVTLCQNTDTVTIVVFEEPDVTIDVSPNDTLCEGEEVILTANGAQDYTWDNNVVDGDSFTQEPGLVTYTVIGDSNGCIDSSEATILVNSNPEISATATPDTILIGDMSELEATGGGSGIYEWDGTFEGNIYQVSPQQDTSYTVTFVDSNGCFDETKVVVYVEGISPQLIEIPTAFSPNGDGNNDVFRVVTTQYFSSIAMNIYNRWGELIHQDEGIINHGWDGTFKGVNQPLDVYSYVIKLVTLDEKEFVLTGSVTLIR